MRTALRVGLSGRSAWPWGTWISASAALIPRGVLAPWALASPAARWCASASGACEPALAKAPSTRRWRAEEDHLLRVAVAQIGADNWAAVSKLVPGRGAQPCRLRWVDYLNPTLASGAWSTAEDEMLTKLVAELGAGQWAAISAAMAGRRSANQCRDRWLRYRQPSLLAVLRTGRWLKEEDRSLREAVAQVGTKDWSAVARLVPGRHLLACRDRWAILSATVVAGTWSMEEDEALVRLVAKLGVKQWVAISAGMVGRSQKQCQYRWRDYLRPGLSKDPFSAQEDEVLLEMFERIGGRWAFIAESLPGRTGSNVRKRHALLMRQRASRDLLPSAGPTRKSP